MSLNELIQQQSEKFDLLFGRLSDTQWSKDALPNLKSNLTNLQNQIRLIKNKIETFKAAADKEYKRLASIRGHGVRHIWYRVRGNIEQQLDTQEKTWLREFEKCKEEEQQLVVLEEALNSTQQQLQQCQTTYEEYVNAKQKLDSLLEHFFSGATPSYPDEDAIERKLEEEKSHLSDLQNHYHTLKQTLALLRSAHKHLILCSRSLNDALQMNTFDVFSSSSFADMAVHSDLAKARNASVQAQQYINEARRFYPSLPNTSNLNIKQDNLVFNIIFDNIWSDLKMRNTIREALNRILNTDRVLTSILVELEQQLKKCEGDQDQVSANVQRMAVEHFNARVLIVKSIIEPSPP